MKVIPKYLGSIRSQSLPPFTSLPSSAFNPVRSRAGHCGEVEGVKQSQAPGLLHSADLPLGVGRNLGSMEPNEFVGPFEFWTSLLVYLCVIWKCLWHRSVIKTVWPLLFSLRNKDKKPTETFEQAIGTNVHGNILLFPLLSLYLGYLITWLFQVFDRVFKGEVSKFS